MLSNQLSIHWSSRVSVIPSYCAGHGPHLVSHAQPDYTRLVLVNSYTLEKRLGLMIGVASFPGSYVGHGGRREAWEWGYDWGNQEVWTVISPAWLVIFIESCTSTLYRGWMDYTWLQRVGGWSACSIYWTTAVLEWMIRLPVLGVQLSITALLQAMEPTSHSSVCSFCWSGEQTKTGRLMRQLLIQRLVIFIRVCINDDWKYQTCMGPNQGVFFFFLLSHWEVAI